MAPRKIQPYVGSQTWDSIASRLTDGVSGPLYLGIDKKRPITVTLYTQGSPARAEEHVFRFDQGRIVPVEVTELALDAKVITDVLTVMHAANDETRGRAAALCRAGELTKTHREARVRPKLERDAAMVELHLVHGWKNKAKIYDLVDTRDRTFLDTAIQESSLAELPGYPDGATCARKVQEWNKAYHEAMTAEETAARLRDNLIRGFVFDWYGPNPATGCSYTISAIAEMASVKPPRVNQICKPNYREQRIQANRARRSRAAA